jgi:divalent metal cation (Fe/Co/Zn/Cd) transporter
MASAIRDAKRARERAIFIGIVMDVGLILLMLVVATWSGSLTMLSETVRAILLLLIEIFALVTLRKINRLQFGAYDYGTGKIEQMVNMVIASGMIVAAVWILVSGYARLGDRLVPSPAALTVTALVGELNFLFNVWAYALAFRAARDGLSVITTAYSRSRMVKLVASGIVLVALVVSARARDPGVGVAADVLGSTFVALFMVAIGIAMLRQGLPDLIDRSLSEAYQLQINRVLARHFDDYDALLAVKTRRAGEAYHIDIRLGFAAGRTIGDIDAHGCAITAELSERIPGAVVAIVASSVDGVSPIPRPADAIA